MKNIDKIRQMNSEELAEYIYQQNDCCNMCVYLDTHLCNGFCQGSDGIRQWLEQETEE